MKSRLNKLILLLKLILLFVIMLGLNSFKLNEKNINYKIQSLFLFKFTQYIEWPNTKANYVIGVVGNSPITEELQNLALSKKNIIIKKLDTNSNMNDCQLIFVSEKSSSSLSEISAKVAGKAILVISETNSGTKKGAGINFVIVDDKMKFELNKSTLVTQGLKVSSALVDLAIVVG